MTRRGQGATLNICDYAGEAWGLGHISVSASDISSISRSSESATSPPHLHGFLACPIFTDLRGAQLSRVPICSYTAVLCTCEEHGISAPVNPEVVSEPAVRGCTNPSEPSRGHLPPSFPTSHSQLYVLYPLSHLSTMQSPEQTSS